MDMPPLEDDAWKKLLLDVSVCTTLGDRTPPLETCLEMQTNLKFGREFKSSLEVAIANGIFDDEVLDNVDATLGDRAPSSLVSIPFLLLTLGDCVSPLGINVLAVQFRCALLWNVEILMKIFVAVLDWRLQIKIGDGRIGSFNEESCFG